MNIASSLVLLGLVGCAELSATVPAAERSADDLARAMWCVPGDVYLTDSVTWDGAETNAWAATYGIDAWPVTDDSKAHSLAWTWCDEHYSYDALDAAGAMIASTSPGVGSYGSVSTTLTPTSLPASYSLDDGLSFSCEMCGYYPLPELDDDPDEPATLPGDGMTWVRKAVDATTGVVTVGCDNGTQCDPIDGDTPCDQELPVLCYLDAGLPLPTSVTSSLYYTWSGGVVGTTAPIAPSVDGLATLADADAWCQEEFGSAWRTAEFHDGWGWNFLAYGNVGESPRFWVDIDDQPNATCWTH